MAKHAKQNNIISYDDAKQKKLREKEEQLKRAAKHLRDKNADHEELYDNGYIEDVQNHKEANINKYKDHKKIKSTFINKRKEKKIAQRDRKYAEPKEPFPRNLINLIVVAIMTLFLAFISIMLYNYYVVESITVIGNHDIKYHDIMELCGVDYKQSMVTVNKEDIVASFESKLPMIEVVDVKKILPNILELTVKERPPICYVVLKGSQKCALIGEGNLCLSIDDSYLDGDIPRIYGLDVGHGELGKELTDGEARKLEVLKLLISAMIETECILELENININNTTNILMESIYGTQIKIGDTTNLITKFEVVKIGIYRLVMENNTDVTMVVTGDNSFYIE